MREIMAAIPGPHIMIAIFRINVSGEAGETMGNRQLNQLSGYTSLHQKKGHDRIQAKR
jgi:hypothetical protein